MQAAGQESDVRIPEMEIRHTMQLEAKAPKKYCKARLSIEYLQKNTIAAVDGVIENPDCGASSGSYGISVRYRDEAGETHSISSDHTWARDDDQPVTFSSEHVIGENVDLIRVSARRVQCVCAESDSTIEDNPGEQQ